MTVREWIDSAKARLYAAGFGTIDLEAQLLAAHTLLVDRAWLMAHPDEPFPELAGESLLAARLMHKPLAYLLGSREFYGRRFSVGPGVLIPRQETETLIETALRLAEGRLSTNPRVLDLGTGSGCIAVTLKLERPEWTVTASDVSSDALEIASRNASDLAADVRFVLSDGFEAIEFKSFDLIVTNPPYIGLGEELQREVAEFEPAQALYSGPTGMEFYERLALESPRYLAQDGLIVMEVGYLQAARVADLFLSRGWQHIETVRDLSGIERVVVCKRP